MKTLFIILLIAILIVLGCGFYFLYQDPGSKNRALNSLIIRVSLALLLITLLIISVAMGWVHPHPVGGQ